MKSFPADKPLPDDEASKIIKMMKESGDITLDEAEEKIVKSRPIAVPKPPISSPNPTTEVMSAWARLKALAGKEVLTGTASKLAKIAGGLGLGVGGDVGGFMELYYRSLAKRGGSTTDAAFINSLSCYDLINTFYGENIRRETPRSFAYDTLFGPSYNLATEINSYLDENGLFCNLDTDVYRDRLIYKGMSRTFVDEERDALRAYLERERELTSKEYEFVDKVCGEIKRSLMDMTQREIIDLREEAGL
ncbi:MAG: hypothetical protein AAB890_02725, partial [Patescibacteria group bacterium]